MMANLHDLLERVQEAGAIPLLARDGHTWVHHGCWESWLDHRRQLAKEALEEIEIRRPTHVNER